jgi:hypothetical protein
MRSPVFLLLLAVLSLFFAGCAGIQNLLSPSVQTTEEKARLEDAAVRAAAIKEYRYQELRDELIVEEPRLSPGTVSKGGELVRDVRFVLLSPEPTKTFMVTETAVLSGAGISLELFRKEGRKRQGAHESTLRIVIPKDLPPGDYTIVTTVATEVQSYKQRSAFKVVK